MLRRLRSWIARWFEDETESLARLLGVLRAHGVSSYEGAGVKLQLAPPPEARDQTAMPKPQQLSDAELLYGEDEASLRRQGLI